MAPGVCNANMGDASDHITVKNLSSGTVSGVYQSSGGKPLGRGGGKADSIPSMPR